MSSKGWKVWLVLFLIGCSKSVGTTDANQIRLRIGSTECFTGMGDRFKHYFSGSAQPMELAQAFTCMSQALNDFMSLTRGHDENRYSKQELRSFIETYFFKAGFSENIVKSTFEFKVALVGGSTDEFTRDEINLLIEKIEAIDDVTQKLWPHTSILFGDKYLSSSDSDFDLAQVAFGEAMQAIAQILKKDGAPYGFSSLQNLVTSWAQYLNLPQDHFINKLAKFIPSLADAKVLLVGGDPNVVEVSQWPHLFSVLSDGFYGYQVGLREWDKSDSDVTHFFRSTRLYLLAEKIEQILRRGVEAQPDKQIKLTRILSLAQKFENSQLITVQSATQKLHLTLQFIIDHMLFNPGASHDGFDPLHLAEFRKRLDRWRTLQVAIDQNSFDSVPEFERAIKPIRFDSLGRLELPIKSMSYPREFALGFMLTEWIGEKWGNYPAGPDAFHTAVIDFLDLFHGLGWLLTIKDSVFKRLLREANLFLPSSNGDKLIQAEEVFQYLAFALSAWRSSKALDRLSGNECGADDLSCKAQVLYGQKSQLLNQYSDLETWLTADNFKSFHASVEFTAGPGSWLTYFMVLQYIESFVSRYDQDRDQMINLKEATSAYPIFGDILSDLLVGAGFDRQETWPLYTFMFRYGATPLSLFGGSVRYLYWKWNVSSWSCTADRETLASILAELNKLQN